MCIPYELSLLVNDANIHSRDLSSLVHFLCGGSVVPEELCRRLRERLPNGLIHNAYGLSETVSLVTVNAPPKRGSVGQLNNGVDMKIIDNNGNRCGLNESGEICIKRLYTFLGYYGDAEATQNAFDADGWFLTGDIGYFDADGYLFIVDRKKDIMKYCCQQISPGDIENAIIEHLDVAQVCVVGIPDAKCTELPAAVIVKKHNSHLTEDDVHKFAEKEFVDSKQLRGGVYFVEDLPRTSSGKVLRRLVREIATQLHAKRNSAT